MAEYKTYTCDYPHCGKQDAIHMEIPGVDHRFDDHDLERESISGWVDLCPEHVPVIIWAALSVFDYTEDSRRRFWGTLLGKH